MHDLQLLSATLVYVVREATGAQHVSLLQRVPREAVLRAGASVGLTEDIEIAFAESGALAQELGAASGVLTLAELEDSPAWWSLPRRQQEELRGADVRLLVPLRFNGHVAGLLALGPRADGQTYGQEECDLLTAIGDEVAPSIENARLYEEVREQLQELQETQAQLLQAGRLATLGTLASGVAHEISNPLFSIQGRVELLQSDSDRHLKSDKAIEYVSVIAEMSQRITTVVNGLLTFSRRDDARGPVDLNAMVTETIGLIERDMAVSGIEVRHQLAETTPRLEGSGAKLKQALMNIMLNAKDAMPQGGVLTIRTGAEGGSAIIACADTGRGIHQAEVARIFDAFYTTKQQGLGAGLGLYISQSIVDEHGGRIQVESEVRRGTNVTILLPISEGADGTVRTVGAPEQEELPYVAERATANQMGGSR